MWATTTSTSSTATMMLIASASAQQLEPAKTDEASKLQRTLVRAGEDRNRMAPGNRLPGIPKLGKHGQMDASQPVPIVLMADYGANPLWRRCESAEGARLVNVNLDSRPLS